MGRSGYRVNRGNVRPWRRIKHGDPVKLKVLAEDLPRRRRRGMSVQSLLIGGLLIAAVGVGYTADEWSLDSFKAMLPGSGCNIKGNISIDTGERIYHVPGQDYYLETRISPIHGERWFCSEAEARSAGWRRSRI